MDPLNQTSQRPVITSRAAEDDLVDIRAFHNDLITQMQNQSARVAEYNAGQVQKKQEQKIQQDESLNTQNDAALKREDLSIKRASIKSV